MKVAPALLALLLLGAPSLARGAVIRVAMDGVDADGCGTKKAPCRTITRGIAVAAPGDRVVVGPGVYGDVDQDGVLGPGEESGSPGCGCVLSLNKPVLLESSHGPALTRIEGTVVDVNTNVLVITQGGSFGKRGKGFSVTSSAQGNGIVIDSDGVAVRGNRLFSHRAAFETEDVAIATVDSAGAVSIENNEILPRWGTGIRVRGANKIVRRNVVLPGRGIGGIGIAAAGSPAAAIEGNFVTGALRGIFVGSGPATVLGNTVMGSSTGIQLGDGSAAVVTRNALVGNQVGVSNFNDTDFTSVFSGVLERNNFVDNRECGIENYGVAGFAARENYWGAPSGPGPDPADAPCDIGGATIAAPFLTRPVKVKIVAKP